jgi:hypothetical protein
MNADLRYAQAIHGVTAGRGTGIIDTIHLVEVARAIDVLRRGGALPEAEFRPIRTWFADYVRWMTTDPNGIEERDAKNNHGTCWVMQVAAFASLTGDRGSLDMCRARFKNVLIPTQMAADGSFPLELERTKPYGYSLFNLDAMATICQIFDGRHDDSLWTFELADGRGMRRALAYMAPFIADKQLWKRPPDVQYFDEWPMRHPALCSCGGLALGEPRYCAISEDCESDSDVEGGRAQLLHQDSRCCGSIAAAVVLAVWRRPSTLLWLCRRYERSGQPRGSGFSACLTEWRRHVPPRGTLERSLTYSGLWWVVRWH